MTKYVLSAFANANKIFHRSNDCWILQNSLNMHKQTKANTKTIGYFRPFFFTPERIPYENGRSIWWNEFYINYECSVFIIIFG